MITPATTLTGGCVLLDEGKIKAVGPLKEVHIPEEARIVDGMGLVLAPGFIDLQLNGGFGHDLTHNPEKIWEVGARLARYGVTSFLPTIITSPLKTIRLAQSIWLQGPPEDYVGPSALGLHIEGPFLNPAKRGAHNPAYLRPPSLQDVVSWSPEMGVRLVTLAPELLGALDVVATLRQRGVVVSAGHSMASFDEARYAITAGVRYATHLFNAMPPLDHRKPGILGALLVDERVTIGVIPDGLHVHPSVIKLIWHVAGDGRLNLVTDAMAALGMPPGQYLLGDYQVTVENDRATLPDGTLAGSVLSLDKGLRNLLNLTGCSLAEVLRTVTTTPATLLGLANRKGQIAPGFDADLVLLTPEFHVVGTLVAGKLIYRRDRHDEPAPKLPGTGPLRLFSQAVSGRSS